VLARVSAWIRVRGLTARGRYAWGAVLLWVGSVAHAENPARAEIIERESNRIRSHVETLGGWAAWEKSLAGWRQAIGALPYEGHGRCGTDGMLFYGGTIQFLQYGLAPVPTKAGPPQSWEVSAVAAARELSAYLATRGIDLIVVPVPNTLSIYPERSGTAPPSQVGVQYLRLVSELLANNVEAIDLYTPFLERRVEGEQLLYYPTDHHWNNRGIALGASIIAERLSRYATVEEAKRRPPNYTRKTVTITQWSGGLTLDADPAKYPPQDIERDQVSNADGTLYAETAEAPIVVIGDSFAQYHRFVGTASDLGPNLAYEINCPVQTLSNDGIVAREVPRRIARQGAAFLNNRVAVVWVSMDNSFQAGQLRAKDVAYPR